MADVATVSARPPVSFADASIALATPAAWSVCLRDVRTGAGDAVPPGVARAARPQLFWPLERTLRLVRRCADRRCAVDSRSVGWRGECCRAADRCPATTLSGSSAGRYHDNADRCRARAGFVEGSRAQHLYFPYDLPGAVQRFLSHVRPRLAVVMETEIWPNLYVAIGRIDLPFFMVNARLSQRSWRGYQPVLPLISLTLGQVGVIAAQSAADARRLRSVGAPAERVRVVGNLKYDLRIPRGSRCDRPAASCCLGQRTSGLDRRKYSRRGGSARARRACALAGGISRFAAALGTAPSDTVRERRDCLHPAWSSNPHPQRR